MPDIPDARHVVLLIPTILFSNEILSDIFYNIPHQKTVYLQISRTSAYCFHCDLPYEIYFHPIEQKNQDPLFQFHPQTIPLKRLFLPLRAVKIKYQKELTYGEIVNVKTEIKHGENKISAYHEIINEKEEVVALLETHWI